MDAVPPGSYLVMAHAASVRGREQLPVLTS